jgi:hypothetical protein
MTIGQIGIGNYGRLMDGTEFFVPDTPLNRNPHQEMTIRLYPGTVQDHERRYHPSTPCRELSIPEQCRLLDGKHVTLDGKPAKVVGFREPFAIIALMEGALRVEYAWETTLKVLKKDGKFYS